MNTILSLFFITVICVFIIDISGALDSLKSALKWIVTKGAMSGNEYRLKPFDCSLCTTFWSGLIYLLIVGKFTLPFVVAVCLFAAFSGIIKSSILLIEDIVTKIIQMIYKWIDNEDNNF